MPFPTAPETPGGPAGTPAASDGQPPQAAQPGPEPDGGGIDLVRVPHPDFAGGGDEPPAGAAPPEGDGAGQGAPAQPQAQEPPAGGGQGEPAPAGPPEGDGDGGGQGTPPYMTLKHRGREIPVDTADKARALAQMGLDYGAKTHAIAPIVQRYPALMQAMADPERAARIDAVLRGEAQPAAQPGTPPAAQAPPAIMFTDPDTGQQVPVDQGFLEVLDQWAQAKGFGSIKPDETLTQRLEALEAIAPGAGEVADRQVDQVHRHIKQTLGFDDFKDSVPLIIEEMAAQGIGRGDPRDNPQTWVDIYKDLRLTGRFTGKRQTTVKPNPGMHQTKVAASGPSPAPGIKAGGIDWQGMTQKALESGRVDDQVAAVAARISHPDLQPQ